MTSKEFNEKYKDYLETGHYGLDIDIPTVVDYLDKEFEEFIKIKGFNYSQIKEKFNTCRFYCSIKDIKDTSKIENNVEELMKQYEIDLEIKKRNDKIDEALED